MSASCDDDYDDYAPRGRWSSRGPGNAGEEGCDCGFTLSWPDGTSEDRAAMLRLWADHESTCGSGVSAPEHTRRRSTDTDAAHELARKAGAA